MWKDNIDLQIDKQFNMINCLVKLDSENVSTLVTCLYGALNDVDKLRQWDHLRNIRMTYNNPWIIIGDLNFIIHRDEKEGGNPISQTELDENNLLLSTNNLHNMNYIGNPYTWSNMRSGDEQILERLGRNLTSMDWNDLYPNAALYHLIALGVIIAL
ncbi:uncharacterized protein LOC113316204 [Papaver somniferum]|uniref:uncharacterized protein LOC113316204 n=1 Tax=Papaver somniferum TaxID=3469 RepID=UPI000E6F6299|nr:uncharacterized protein LOC113316204 [Papaver somniferum]